MQKEKPFDALLTRKEVLGIFRVSEQCLNSWMRQGLLPFVKVRRTVRFKRSDVASFIETHTFRSSGKKNARGSLRKGDLC